MPETDLLITQDGSTFVLNPTKTKHVLSEEGTGMPEIEYITQRGPFQDGETVRDYFLRPRVLQLHVRQQFCSRMDYWRGRQALLSILAPNRVPGNSRGSPQATLRKVLGDGTTYDLKVVIQQGPAFQARQANVWDEWAIDEIIRLVAYDPVYESSNEFVEFIEYAPHFPYTFDFELFNDTLGLVFDTTFPITFGTFDKTRAIDYNGTWQTYPDILFTGPFEYFRITNLTTNEKLNFNYRITEGEQIYVTLQFGNKNAYKVGDPGTSLLGFFSTDSDVATFHLRANVPNEINVHADGVGMNTNVRFMYRERFIGI